MSRAQRNSVCSAAWHVDDPSNAHLRNRQLPYRLLISSAPVGSTLYSRKTLAPQVLLRTLYVIRTTPFLTWLLLTGHPFGKKYRQPFSSKLVQHIPTTRVHHPTSPAEVLVTCPKQSLIRSPIFKSIILSSFTAQYVWRMYVFPGAPRVPRGSLKSRDRCWSPLRRRKALHTFRASCERIPGPCPSASDIHVVR
jgi:hypothetical protein